MNNSFDNFRILVIDDNRTIHEDFRKIFTSGAASSGLESAELALLGGTAAQADEASFEIDSAFQGEEGFNKARQALAACRT